MKHFILLLLISTSSVAYSQSLSVKDSIPPFDRNSLKYNEKLDDYLNFEKKHTLEENKLSTSNASLYKPLQKADKQEFELSLPPLNIYTGPPLENNTFTQYPFANDYSFYSGISISDKAWISTSSIQRGYPTMGAVRSIGAQLNYQPADWIIMSGGPYGAKYNMYGSNFTDVGVSGAVKFIVHDRIRLNAYGQYSRNDTSRGLRGPVVNMYPQTYYGGSVEFKITEKFGIESGVIRELNPMNGKWENRPFIAPVFYSK